MIDFHSSQTDCSVVISLPKLQQQGRPLSARGHVCVYVCVRRGPAELLQPSAQVSSHTNYFTSYY